ncbi:MAG: putative transcriptional regulatory protein AraC family, partial [Rubritepida sp.]|nr:putative transcriptional regulatory protein AraC family [Rubritepida sp.]
MGVHVDTGIGKANSVASLAFTDVEDLAAAVSDANIKFLPIESGPCDARMTMININGLRMQRASIPPHSSFGAVNADRVALLMTLAQPCEPTLNGHGINRSDLMILGPGTELHGVCRRQESWATISFDAGDFHALMEDLGMSRIPSGMHHILQPQAAELMTLSNGVAAAADLIDSVPQLIESTGFASGLADALMDNLYRVLTSAAGRGDPQRLDNNNLRIVRAADAFMHAHIATPLYTADLCKAVGVSSRRLRAAFEAACGISPHAYLKSRRLHLVRSALREHVATPRLVKSVALDHGFWHMSNFA